MGIESDSLSGRIGGVFERAGGKILIQDRDREFSGERLRAIVREIRETVEALTPEGSRVAVMFPNSSVQAIAILATLYARRVPVILNPELISVGAAKKIESMGVAAVLSGPTSQPSSSSQIILDNEGRILRRFVRPLTRAALADPRVALVLMTSGSKGGAKAVQLTHSGLNYIVAYLIRYFGLDESARAAIGLPIFHTMALNTQFLPTFIARGTSLFMNSEDDCTTAYTQLLRERANFLTVIGDLLFVYKKERELRGLPRAVEVRHVQLAGGVISRENLDLARELFPNARIHKGYGLTEAIRTAMIHSDQPGFLDDCVGYVLPGQTVEIRGVRGKRLAGKQIGEIYIKSPTTMLSYLDPTPPRKGAKPPIDTNGFLSTGDLGYLDESGRLHFCGRRDDIFKMRGKRISAVEIERATKKISFVADAKCIPVPCTRRGFKPILVTQLHPAENRASESHAPLKQKIRKHLLNCLEDYKVPGEILVVDALPRLPNRKINVRAVYDYYYKTAAKG